MSRAGRPSQRNLDNLVAVATEHMQPGHIYYQAVRHDNWCPTLKTQRLGDCTCEPEFTAPIDVTPKKPSRPETAGD